MRCFIPPAAWSTGTMALESAERHHLVDVLRAGPGTEITVFDGAGREAVARVDAIGRHDVRLTMIQQQQHAPPAVAVTLVQAVPREQRMDMILQKATELGAAAILPVITERSVVRLREADEGKHDRWQKIILNAAKQCGTAWLPQLAPVQPALEALGHLPPADLRLVCSLEPDARPLREVVQEARARGPARVTCLIGPEGDFSAREYAAARQAGARPVSFGPLVLRVETAALYVLSVLRYEFT